MLPAIAATQLFFKGIPTWVYWVLIVVAIYLVGRWDGASAVKEKWELEKATIKAESQVVLNKRLQENQKEQDHQNQVNQEVVEKLNRELKNANSELHTLRGLRLKPTICPGNSTTSNSESPKGADGTSTAGGTLPDDIAEDLDELMEQAEHDAAIARNCQDWIRKNKLFKEK